MEMKDQWKMCANCKHYKAPRNMLTHPFGRCTATDNEHSYSWVCTEWEGTEGERPRSD